MIVFSCGPFGDLIDVPVWMLSVAARLAAGWRTHPMALTDRSVENLFVAIDD